MPNKRLYLTLNDRVRRNGECYRPAERLEQAWVLMHVVDGEMLVDDDDAWHLTDKRQQELRDAKVISVDENYFSAAGKDLATRDDDLLLHDLTDAELRTIAWKVEWCTRWNRARAGLDGRDRKPALTPKGLAAFIEGEREAVHRWYIHRYRMPRPPGRDVVGLERKTYDYPGPTTLREWIAEYEDAGFRSSAFKPGYGRCGNRHQLDDRLLGIITQRVEEYASRGGVAKDDVFMDVDNDVRLLNDALPRDAQLSVNERAVRRRVNRLAPIVVDAGRLGPEVAGRKYTPVGQGLRTYDGLEVVERMGRVEMDDWEMDLFAILNDAEVYDKLTPEGREAARKVDPKVRCTVTAGIDVVTRCIVALNVTPGKPSTMGSRRALHSMFVDKSGWARLAKATSGWPMTASPREVATDGGPAFEGEFRDTVGRLGITHRYPGGNPTSRGHIESFFRTFKRFCRMFTGQAFANVVKRGDYEAEALASAMAHEIELLLVRFIVDEYHRRPHSGLGGMSPLSVWERSSNDLLPPPDEVQRHAAFGIRKRNLRIRAPGVTFMHVQYKHPKMGVLHGLVGRRELTGVINPNDLGTILVLVPAEARRAIGTVGDFMAFKADEFRGVPLARLEHYNDELKRFAAEEAAAGRTVRHEARQFIKRAAEEARIRAGVPSDVMTGEQHAVFLERMVRAGERASAPRPKPEGAPMSAADEPDTLGVSIARKPGSGRVADPAKPTDRKSVNRYRDEER
jgi:transposase InsO family protein